MTELALILLCIFAGAFGQWAFVRFIVYPRCSECGARAMPHTALALVRANQARENAEAALLDVKIMADKNAHGASIDNDKRPSPYKEGLVKAYRHVSKYVEQIGTEKR